MDCDSNSVCLEGGFNGTIVSINQMFHLVFYKPLVQFGLSTLQVKGDTISYQGPMYPGVWEVKGSVKGQLNCSIISNLCALSMNVKAKTNNGVLIKQNIEGVLNLNSEDSDLSIEELEIAHEGVTFQKYG